MHWLIADACFKAGYVDAWGRGTLKIIEASMEAGLPEPTLKEEQGGFLSMIYKDRFTEDQLKKMGLDDRQVEAVLFVKKHGEITNSIYQKVAGVSKATATRNIKELEEKGVLKNTGTKGSSAIYKLAVGS
jgi:ATP-dependent DNA helicase RecG